MRTVILIWHSLQVIGLVTVKIVPFIKSHVNLVLIPERCIFFIDCSQNENVCLDE